MNKLKDKMDEQIIVVSRKEVFDNEKLTFQGVENDVSIVDSISSNIDQHYSVMRRGDAEEDNTFKQPISYVVIRRNDEIFTYKRLSQGGEARLFDKLSIGAGGHMNYSETAGSFQELILENLDRELEEELSIQSAHRNLQLIGLINDDLNEVGEVHIGVLAVLDLSPDAVVDVLEKDQLEGQWLTAEELKGQPTYDKLEPWSKMSVDALCHP